MQRAIAIAKWMRTSRCSEISFSPQFCAPKSPRPALLKIRGNTRNSFSDDQAMDIMRAFIGVNRFKIVHMPHDAVVVDDSVGAENVASLTSGFHSDPHIIHLQHRDVRGVQTILIF